MAGAAGRLRLGLVATFVAWRAATRWAAWRHATRGCPIARPLGPDRITEHAGDGRPGRRGAARPCGARAPLHRRLVVALAGLFALTWCCRKVGSCWRRPPGSARPGPGRTDSTGPGGPAAPAHGRPAARRGGGGRAAAVAVVPAAAAAAGATVHRHGHQPLPGLPRRSPGRCSANTRWPASGWRTSTAPGRPITTPPGTTPPSAAGPETLRGRPWTPMAPCRVPGRGGPSGPGCRDAGRRSDVAAPGLGPRNAGLPGRAGLRDVFHRPVDGTLDVRDSRPTFEYQPAPKP